MLIISDVITDGDLLNLHEIFFFSLLTLTVTGQINTTQPRSSHHSQPGNHSGEQETEYPGKNITSLKVFFFSFSTFYTVRQVFRACKT